MATINLVLRSTVGRMLTWAEGDANTVAVANGLLNSSDVQQGTGMIAHNSALNYGAGTAGYAINNSGVLGPFSTSASYTAGSFAAALVTLYQTVGTIATSLTGYAQLAAANVFTKGQAVTPVGLTYAASIATDASLSNNFFVTLTGNATLANPTNLQSGEVLNYKIKQDATGSRTLAYGSMFKFPGGTPPVLSTAANARDLLTCQYWADEGILVCNMLNGMA